MKQLNVRTESKEMRPPVIKVNSIEAAKAALPFFGGTPDDPETETTTEEPETTTTTDSSAATGGQPGAELTPEQIAAIVAKNVELEKTAKEANTKLEGYTQKEKEAEKAKLGEVERRDQEIAERDQTIAQLDKVIREQAVVNAINNVKDIRFHSAKHVIAELDPAEYDIDVDLKAGTATVTGLEKALKAIAEKNPWMVDSGQAQQQNPGNGNAGARQNPNPGGKPRGSGNPPTPGNSRNATAAQSREALIKKFPVLAARR